MDARALGWDIHRRFSKVSLMEMSPEGPIQAVERARLEHDDREGMREWLARLDPEIPVALEAAFGWPWVADLLEGFGHPVHLGHPRAIWALAKHEAKTDRCDSDRLGVLHSFSDLFGKAQRGVQPHPPLGVGRGGARRAKDQGEAGPAVAKALRAVELRRVGACTHAKVAVFLGACKHGPCR